MLSSEAVALCVPGLTTVEAYTYETELVEGVATYFSLVRAKVRIINILVGCDNATAPAAGRRGLVI